ncbi:choice-of-anchor B family protein [Neolewinella litorea]|uniref:Choice-of-anchor B family protein n=1 Tax=Neolewinella litorea TaxID=2562452 RepID=A0A4S4NSW2_9BACT|nr:choice-of-anchor B family protein [Neolewinella litorea]THH41538.1 choice-of-anchor B family protein [Neolewinella litorea]
MKLTLLLFSFLACLSSLDAQLNATLRSNVDFGVNVNDIWGYVAPDGTEYALMGLDTGIAVISLAEPDAPVVIDVTSQPTSIWRDIKSYRGFAYATADQGSYGLTVIDLRELPEKISYQPYTYEVPGYPGTFSRAHNLYIDTLSGLLFTAGGDRNINDGGVLIFDLKENPAEPRLIAQGPPVYAHDVYVQDDIMYASEIYLGELGIYNISDLANITKLGSTQTPYRFTHNAWSNQDGTVVYTTDEVANASVAAFDLTDYNDIELLDEYRPLTSLNTRTIPHNVHFINDYLSISYYTDGLRVVDASDPTNLIEVANYDTYDGPDGGFNGDWGAYPFLPSGLTLVSDRQSGLFVVDVNYVRAARLRGTVNDGDADVPLNGARVEILTEQANLTNTDATGNYATGIAGEGSYQVVASAEGFYPDTVTVTLTRGEEVMQDFTLTNRQTTAFAFVVADGQTGAPVVDVRVDLLNPDGTYTALSDSAGAVRFAEIFDYDYTVVATAWGYQLEILEEVHPMQTALDTFFLDRGYEDSFVTDLGWTVSGNATRGKWERGVPTATYNIEGPGQPGEDSPWDFGDQGYFTDPAGGNSNSRDVDRGETQLRSPLFDLTDYGSGVMLTYDYWFSNLSGNLPPNDSLTVALSNGDSTLTLAVYRGAVTEWQRDTILLDGLLPFTGEMQLIVTTADENSSDNLVEAAFDNFRVLDSLMLSPTPSLPQNVTRVEVYPNPTSDVFQLAYDLETAITAEVEIFSVTGQRMFQQRITGRRGNLTFGEGWAPGLYLVRITSGGRLLQVGKAIKR